MVAYNAGIKGGERQILEDSVCSLKTSVLRKHAERCMCISVHVPANTTDILHPQINSQKIKALEFLTKKKGGIRSSPDQPG